MKCLCVCFGLAAFAFNSFAMVQIFGREPVNLVLGTNGLNAVINHPTRFSGTVGPYGLTSRFQYSGTSSNFIEVLNLYSKLPQPVHTLYLTAEGIAEPAEPSRLLYELSVNHDGQAFLHLHVAPGTDLSFLKSTTGINLESLPEPGEPVESKAKEKVAAAQRIINDILKRADSEPKGK